MTKEIRSGEPVETEKKKALIAMSGGVDSSIAAKIMVDEGYECIGCTMKLFQNENIGKKEHTCCSLEDVEDAKSVAFSLGMNYYVFNFTDDFYDKIIRKFVDCYENGITPNPCIDCNRYMKFDKLFDRAKVLGCEYIVTGHYAKIEKSGEKFVLKKALDKTKDQSYVLYSLTQEQLAHLKFPLGNLEKSEVRNIASNNNFVNANKPDSQDICFVPDGDYTNVIKLNTKNEIKRGNFVTTDGLILGKNKGIIYYTIGQRKGLKISSDKPYYVCKICSDSGGVVLGHREDLLSKETVVTDFNWISGEISNDKFRCMAKTRYRQEEQSCTVYVINKKTIRIVFDDMQRAITPGQAAVLYNGDIVIGGGTITENTFYSKKENSNDFYKRKICHKSYGRLGAKWER